MNSIQIGNEWTTLDNSYIPTEFHAGINFNTTNCSGFCQRKLKYIYYTTESEFSNMTKLEYQFKLCTFQYITENKYKHYAQYEDNCMKETSNILFFHTIPSNVTCKICVHKFNAMDKYSHLLINKNSYKQQLEKIFLIHNFFLGDNADIKLIIHDLYFICLKNNINS